MTKDKEQKTLNTAMLGESLDIAARRRAELKQLFPGAFTETVNDKGELVESIDFERLKAELGTFSDLYEGRRERYGMDWPGKRECLKLIQQPSRATLKPCREESVDFDTTQNLFIEGDNLEVLKLLQKSYYGRIKMIYIDPPYNTGNEFIYPDNYSESLETYLAYAGLIDDEGKKFSTNTANEGRFHTKWLNMMYPRLYLARNLLMEDGVIFISIDDNEVENLRRMCDEIFGEENFIAQMVWEGAFKNDAKQIGTNHEYVLVFARNRNSLTSSWVIKKEAGDVVLKEVERLKRIHGEDYEAASEELAGWFRANKAKPWFAHRRFRYIDKHGAYKEDDPTAPGGRKIDLINPKTGDIIPLRKNRGWSFDQQAFNDLVEQEKISFITPTSIMVRRYFHETDMVTPQSVFYQPARSGSERLTKLVGPGLFDFPKDETVIQQFIEMATSVGDIVLDFFAGSATTAHAAINECLIGHNVNYVMVQLPEKLQEDSPAFLAGYKTIADLAKNRIRKVIADSEQRGQKNLDLGIDLGFRVLKLDKSNFKQWRPLAPDVSDDQLKEQLELQVDHLDPIAQKEAILYELLLKSGIQPTKKIELAKLAAHEVYLVEDGHLIICLEDKISRELINAVVTRKPQTFICLDKAFHGNDQLKANAVETFAAHNEGLEKIDCIEFRTV